MHPCPATRIPCSQGHAAAAGWLCRVLLFPESARKIYPAHRALLLRRFLDSAGQQPDAWEHIALVLTNATRRYLLALRTPM